MSKSRTIGWVLVIAAVGAAGYFGWQKYSDNKLAAEASQKRAAQQRPAVPVKISPVEKADFPVYLTGLGTVQAFNTVQVRTRVPAPGRIR